MKYTVLLCLLGICAVSLASPINILRVDGDDFKMEQDVDDDDDAVTGTYSWTSPEGQEFFVKYIADDKGFRVLESNAIPVSVAGVKADGSQGSFLRSDDDHHHNDDHFDDDDK